MLKKMSARFRSGIFYLGYRELFIFGHAKT